MTDRDGGSRDRDGALHTRADLLGLALTALASLFAGALRGDWLLLPAGYWALILALRLTAVGRGREHAGERNR